jgi:beta-galactosidase
MHMQRNALGATVARSLGFLAAWLVAAAPAIGRERQLLDPDWRFFLGDNAAAAQADFDDAGWRAVNLPHDWSIEGAPQADAPSGGSGAYLPTGVRWYRRTFTPPPQWKEQLVRLEFEGVYHRCEVWLNGQSLGKHAYGYTPFGFDLTPNLKLGEPNVVAVRVDNSQQANCRWYSGSGIYRHVWLEATAPLHLVRDELFVATRSATPESAAIQVRTALRNDAGSDATPTMELELYDSSGDSLLKLPNSGRIAAGATVAGTAGLTVRQPRLWSPDVPRLYRLVARVKVDNRVVDELETRLGIRTVKVSPERGFELNGQPLKLIGACVHHDHGPLGAAAFDRAEVRKVEQLKAAGFNAVRTAHNPPSVAFLDACDRLGLLVLDEAFDGWAARKTPFDYHLDFADNWQADLEAFVRRDRNHPSVIMWSIGNEMFERGEDSGARIAAEMAPVVRKLDDTRPITAACNHVNRSEEGWRRVDRVFAPLDVAGYNYQLDVVDADHERLPERIICATESFPFETFRNWDMIDSRPYFIGDFVWTGIDYLGEAGLGRVFAPGEQARDPWVGPPLFPSHGAPCGDIDLTGWRKPNSHYRNILWDRGEKLYAAVVAPAPEGGKWQLTRWSQPPALPSWTWPGHEGKELEVVVYSRYDEVQLELNGKPLLDAKSTGRDQQFQATFRVPYQPGELRILGMKIDPIPNGVRRSSPEQITLMTTGEAANIRLTPDRTELAADGQDLAFVTVAIADANGLWRPDAAAPVTYEIAGPGVIVGIGSADLESQESYQANPRRTYQGRALVVVRTTESPGEITLRASSHGFESTPVTLTATAP